MLNSFQHLIKMIFNKTLKQVQGDRKSIFFFLPFLFPVSCFLFPVSSFPQCNCKEETLDEAYIQKHQLIFRGKTLAVSKGEDYSKVIFSIEKLFKGIAPKKMDIYFYAKNECSLKFNTGEEWLIYSNYKQATKPFVEYCSRSRKNVINTNKNIDRMYIKADYGFDEENEWLEKKLGLKNFVTPVSENDSLHSNIIPSFWQRIVLILVSVFAFAAIYFGVTKWLKRF